MAHFTFTADNFVSTHTNPQLERVLMGAGCYITRYEHGIFVHVPTGVQETFHEDGLYSILQFPIGTQVRLSPNEQGQYPGKASIVAVR